MRFFPEPKPYRLAIFARRLCAGRKYKRYTELVMREYGYVGWTEKQYYNEARLPGAGSFLYPGLHAARRAAFDALSLPNVYQVQIRSNQDRKVYLWNKHSDGRISGYQPEAF